MTRTRAFFLGILAAVLAAATVTRHYRNGDKS